MTAGGVWFIVPLLLAALGCGDSPEPVLGTRTPVPSTTPTRTIPPTATSTLPPTATAPFTSTIPPSATPTATRTRPPAMALFDRDPQSGLNPFPTDRLLVDGHVLITAQYLSADVPPDAKYDMLRAYLAHSAEQLSRLDGFSTFAPVRVKFDREATVGAGENPAGVYLFPCDRDRMEQVRVTAAAVTPEESGDFAIEIQPVLPLAPRQCYFFALTNRIRDAAGLPVARAPEFAAALDGDIPTLAAWSEKVADGLALLENAGVDDGDVVVIDYFTTQPIVDDMLSITRLLDEVLPPPQPVFENSPVPGLETGIFPAGSPQFASYTTADNLAAVAVGSFAAYDFRAGRQSGFDPDRVSGAVAPGINHIDFYMTIPKAPPPPGGYPVVIFGHGLGGSGAELPRFGGLFGDAPIVLIGISALEHGRRGSVAAFFNFTDSFATREHFRQSVVDMMQLRRMVKHATVPPFDRVNHDDIRYMGVSLGGIMGTLFLGYEPGVRVGVLSVPGGGLPRIINSNEIGDLLKPLLGLTAGVSLDDPYFPALLHRFFHIAQWAVDAGDPINVAPYMLGGGLPGVPPKLVLMHEGVIDDIIPNVTTDDLARAMGLPDAKSTRGCMSDDGCSGIWRFVMTDYGRPFNDGHSVSFTVPQAFDQARQFVLSNGTRITDASP